MAADDKMDAPVEGLRERKRRETRKRIAVAALTLFRERGYTAVTVDQIAQAANVSKRSFFDYFPSKEEVVATWQDDFALALGDAIVARPKGESIAQTVEHAMADAVLTSISPDAEFVNELIAATPALQVHKQSKYIRLERVLADALAERYPEMPRLKLKMFSMVAVGVLRLGVEEWNPRDLEKTGYLRSFNAEMYGLLWEEVGEARLREIEKSQRKTL